MTSKKSDKKISTKKLGPLTVSDELPEAPVEVKLVTDQLLCPVCSHILLPSVSAGKVRTRKTTLSCSNNRCSEFSVHYELPTLYLFKTVKNEDAS